MAPMVWQLVWHLKTNGLYNCKGYTYNPTNKIHCFNHPQAMSVGKVFAQYMAGGILDRLILHHMKSTLICVFIDLCAYRKQYIYIYVYIHIYISSPLVSEWKLKSHISFWLRSLHMIPLGIPCNWIHLIIKIARVLQLFLFFPRIFWGKKVKCEVTCVSTGLR